ncbi:MAG TPA: sulfite exporter TauE/SafE family protein, partial [Pirellulales bacterium]|nr:sulfite exporter TauE/SafE family protein [Pirellulales bacterium]
AVALQFFIAIYGGYFGAGIGILMLTSLAVMGLHDIHEMNALKSVLGTIINGTSVVVFVASGSVDWPFATAMAAASVVGGYAGARVARRMNRQVVRWIVVTIGLTLAGYYFWRH